MNITEETGKFLAAGVVEGSFYLGFEGVSHDFFSGFYVPDSKFTVGVGGVDELLV